MDGVQNQTLSKSGTDSEPQVMSADDILSFNQEQYIGYVAFGGLVPDPDGNAIAIKMTASQFAKNIKVARSTLYDWRNTIPNFWERVAEKRKEVGGKDRLSKVWNGVYMKAAAGNAEAAKLYLANFDPDFRMPMEKVQHEAGNSWASLFKNKPQAIEGEATDESKPDTLPG